MKKIIVPVDFSKTSSQALDFAIEFCQKTGGEIILVHVIELPVGHMAFSGEVHGAELETFYTGEYIKASQEKLETWKNKVVKANLPVWVEMKFGNAFTNISALISELKADLIIMGSKGASGLKEVFIGSNAERMIRFAKCPVLVIKDSTHLNDIQSITFVSDLSEEQDSIAQQAKDVQSLLDVNMHLIKVKTPYNWLDEVQVTKQLERFAERNQLTDCTFSSVEADFVDEGAVQFAKDNNSGLIIMGTHGKKGLAHLIGGSIAEDVVNESAIPMLIYKIAE